MKKSIFLLPLISLIIILLTPFTAFAQDSEYEGYLESFDLSAFESLDDETREFLDDLGITDFDYEKISQISVSDIFKYIFEVLTNKTQGPIKAGLTVICFVIVSANSFKELANTSSAFFTVSGLVRSTPAILSSSIG